MWTVPATRTKAKREHCVPLCLRAEQVLDATRAISNGNALVFPSGRGKRLNDMALSGLRRTLEVPAVPHGDRGGAGGCALGDGDRRRGQRVVAPRARVPHRRAGGRQRHPRLVRRGRVVKRCRDRHLGAALGRAGSALSVSVVGSGPWLSPMVSVSAAVSAGLALAARGTMVSPPSSSVSSVTVIVAVPVVSPSAMVIVVADSA